MNRLAIALLAGASCVWAQANPSPEKVAAMKADLAGQIDGMKKQAQVMVDSVFSFAELGFQEFETSKYLTGILEKEGFTIERGISGIPTAFMATWGHGKPVIALGSDIDDIPQASNKPGVAYHDPMIVGAPGHGEGHNSGMPLQIVAAIAVKRLMEREHIQGTIKLWPGVAEEDVGTKAYYVRDGYFNERGCGPVLPRGHEPGRHLRAHHQQRADLGGIQLQGRKRACRRRALAWTQRSGRGGVDGRRHELPARASAARHARALRDHQRGRPAQRGSAQRDGLVLLPRSRLRTHHELVEDRRQHGQGRHADDGHYRDRARFRQRLAGALQHPDRRRHVREHQEGRAAGVVGGGPNPGQGGADRVESAGDRLAHQDPAAAQAEGLPKTKTHGDGDAVRGAAGRTTLAISRGLSRRSR